QSREQTRSAAEETEEGRRQTTKEYQITGLADLMPAWLLPPEGKQHVRAARRALLLAARSMVDSWTERNGRGLTVRRAADGTGVGHPGGGAGGGRRPDRAGPAQLRLPGAHPAGERGGPGGARQPGRGAAGPRGLSATPRCQERRRRGTGPRRAVVRWAPRLLR